MIFKKIRQIIYVDGFNFLFHKKNKNMILEESFKSCIFMSIQLGQKNIRQEIISRLTEKEKNEIDHKFQEFSNALRNGFQTCELKSRVNVF